MAMQAFFEVFYRILEACAQTRKCKKPVKTYGFSRFFVGRVFFAKGGAVEVNSTKKTTLGGQFEGQNGVEVALGGQFGRQNGVQEALGGQLERTNGVQVTLGGHLRGPNGVQVAL